MKLNLLSLSFLLLFAAVVGCGDAELRTSTDGADADAIAAYEEAVARSEANMESAVEESEETE